MAFILNSKVVVGVYHISDNAVSVIKGSFTFTTVGISKLEPVDFPLYLQVIIYIYTLGLNFVIK